MLELELLWCKNRMLILRSFAISLEHWIQLRETILIQRENFWPLFMHQLVSSTVFSGQVSLVWRIVELSHLWERKPSLIPGLWTCFFSCTSLPLGSTVFKVLRSQVTVSLDLIWVILKNRVWTTNSSSLLLTENILNLMSSMFVTGLQESKDLDENLFHWQRSYKSRKPCSRRDDKEKSQEIP